MILEFLRLSHGHHRIEALFTQQQRCIQKAPLFKRPFKSCTWLGKCVAKKQHKMATCWWCKSPPRRRKAKNLDQTLGVFCMSSHTIQPSILWDPGPPRVHVSEVEEDASGPSPPKPLEESYKGTTAGAMSRNVKNLISRKYRTTMSHLSWLTLTIWQSPICKVNPPETGWFNIQQSQMLCAWIYNQLPRSDLMDLWWFG